MSSTEAMQILKDLETSASSVANPTAYVAAAARRLRLDVKSTVLQRRHQKGQVRKAEPHRLVRKAVAQQHELKTWQTQKMVTQNSISQQVALMNRHSGLAHAIDFKDIARPLAGVG